MFHVEHYFDNKNSVKFLLQTYNIYEYYHFCINNIYFNNVSRETLLNELTFYMF